MRNGQIVSVVFAGMALSACADTPSPAAGRDVAFVWGCWVARDEPGGPPTAFLRLLPESPRIPVYAGAITDVREGKWSVGTRYEFARDGSLVVVTSREGAPRTYRRAEKTPPNRGSDAPTRATYLNGNDRLVVEGGNERLVLAEHGSLLHLWEFERDGCD